MADLFQAFKQQFPNMPDEQVNSAIGQIRQQVTAQSGGQPVSDDQLVQAFSTVAPAVMQKVAQRPTQQATPVQPSSGGYNAVQGYDQAEDKYNKALTDIKAKRNAGRLGYAMNAGWYPEGLKNYDAGTQNALAETKDATLGSFDRRNTMQTQQETRDRNATTDTFNMENQNRQRKDWQRNDSMQAEADDPNSATSQAAREAMKAQQKLYPDLNIDNIDGMSKTQIDKIYPTFKNTVDMYVKHQEHEDTIAQRRDANNNAAAQRQLQREQTAALAADKVQAKVDEKTKEQKAKDENVLDTTSQGLAIIGKLRNHPGLSDAVGGRALNSYLPFVPEEGLSGTNQRDFNELNKQLQAQSFLSSIQKMKGMGALSNIEGEKAQAALAQLSTHQSEKQYNQALDDLETILKNAQTKLSGGQVPNVAAENAPTTPTKKKVYNPTTGKIE